MRKFLFAFSLLYSITFFGQKSNIQKETRETIEWINSKLTEFQYENKSDDMIQTCQLSEIVEINGEYYLTGIREQKTSKPWAFKLNFTIPISQINNVSIEEKQYNFWINIRMKNNEKSITTYKMNGEIRGNISNMDIILNKSILNEKIDQRLIKAFNYLFEMYGYNKNEKF